MSRALIAVYLVIALCYLPQAVLAQQHNPELQERFIHGVKQSWRKLQDISFRARCVSTSTDSASVEPNTRTYEFGVRGPMGLQTGVRDGIPFVQSRNDAYAFVLSRSTQESSASLQFLERVGVDPSIDAKVADIERTPRAMAFAAYYLWKEPLAHVIELDSFEINRVYAAPSEDNEFVRVEFDYSIDDPLQNRKERNTDGFLVCDPTRQWIVKEYGAGFLNLNDNAAATRRIVLEHDDEIDAMPIATKITVSFARNDMDYTSETVMNLTVTARDLPQEELYLSYYGLPEPNFRRSWFGTWGWYLIGGVGCIVVGVILVRRRKTGR